MKYIALLLLILILPACTSSTLSIPVFHAHANCTTYHASKTETTVVWDRVYQVCDLGTVICVETDFNAVPSCVKK